MFSDMMFFLYQMKRILYFTNDVVTPIISIRKRKENKSPGSIQKGLPGDISKEKEEVIMKFVGRFFAELSNQGIMKSWEFEERKSECEVTIGNDRMDIDEPSVEVLTVSR